MTPEMVDEIENYKTGEQIAEKKTAVFQKARGGAILAY
jgi:hypothetical protein